MGNPQSKPAVYDEPTLGISIFLIVITTVCVVARVLSRWIQKADFSIDDYLCYLAYTTNLAQLICGILLIPKNATSLPGLMQGNPDDIDFMTQTFIGIGVVYILTILFSKLSVLFLFRRIFTMFNTKFRVAWWINLLFLIPCWSVTSFTLLGITVVRKDLRNSDISSIGTPTIAVFNALSDIMVLLLPIWSVLKLRLPKKQKIALCGVFGVGMIATGVSIGRAALLFIRRTTMWNAAYNNYMDIIMTAAECSAAVMCSCLPVLKPIILKINGMCSNSVSRIASGLPSRRDGTNSKRLSLHSDREDTFDYNSSQKGIHRMREYEVDVIPLNSRHAV